MHAMTRMHTVSFDTVSRRYHGEVALTRPDGSQLAVEASVIGHPQWPLERVARQLLGAARQQTAIWSPAG